VTSAVSARPEPVPATTVSAGSPASRGVTCATTCPIQSPQSTPSAPDAPAGVQTATPVPSAITLTDGRDAGRSRPTIAGNRSASTMPRIHRSPASPARATRSRRSADVPGSTGDPISRTTGICADRAMTSDSRENGVTSMTGDTSRAGGAASGGVASASVRPGLQGSWWCSIAAHCRRAGFSRASSGGSTRGGAPWRPRLRLRRRRRLRTSAGTSSRRRSSPG
jgi:hypothetical protein